MTRSEITKMLEENFAPDEEVVFHYVDYDTQWDMFSTNARVNEVKDDDGNMVKCITLD